MIYTFTCDTLATPYCCCDEFHGKHGFLKTLQNTCEDVRVFSYIQIYFTKALWTFFAGTVE